jgi:hypothetical protein
MPSHGAKQTWKSTSLTAPKGDSLTVVRARPRRDRPRRCRATEKHEEFAPSHTVPQGEAAMPNGNLPPGGVWRESTLSVGQDVIDFVVTRPWPSRLFLFFKFLERWPRRYGRSRRLRRGRGFGFGRCFCSRGAGARLLHSPGRIPGNVRGRRITRGRGCGRRGCCDRIGGTLGLPGSGRPRSASSGGQIGRHVRSHA